MRASAHGCGSIGEIPDKTVAPVDLKWHGSLLHLDGVVVVVQ
jgi:hypothetical protein